MTISPLTLRVGESPSELFANNHHVTDLKVDRQPAGSNFYEIRWPQARACRVRIEHDRHGFEIRDVLSVQGVENTDYLDEGVSQYLINATLALGLNGHDRARERFSGLLLKLIDRGWSHAIGYSAPRLRGRDSLRYALEDDTCSPSPSYVLTLDEWMALGAERTWTFHANDQFLRVTFRRDPTRMDVKREGDYLISLELVGSARYARSYFAGARRARWRDLWVEEIRKLKRIRAASERDLSRRGFKIHRDYVEPRVHPQDPVSP